jgi:hypothetical protein
LSALAVAAPVTGAAATAAVVGLGLLGAGADTVRLLELLLVLDMIRLRTPADACGSTASSSNTAAHCSSSN